MIHVLDTTTLKSISSSKTNRQDDLILGLIHLGLVVSSHPLKLNASLVPSHRHVFPKRLEGEVWQSWPPINLINEETSLLEWYLFLYLQHHLAI
jgi:hypothetical protein